MNIIFNRKENFGTCLTDLINPPNKKLKGVSWMVEFNITKRSQQDNRIQYQLKEPKVRTDCFPSEYVYLLKVQGCQLLLTGWKLLSIN